MALVIYVDDDDLVRDVVTELLRSSGLNVIGCRTGIAAVAALDEVKADVMLVDLNMPEPDGFEVARRVRSAHPQLRLVAITGRATAENKRMALRAGFDEFLQKPASLSDLLAALT
jgi:CheY-like chemotaxis protein